MKNTSYLMCRAWCLAVGVLLVVFGGTSLAAEPTTSVVSIYTQLGDKGSSQGTGFLIGQSGVIATAYHVVQDATSIEVIDARNSRYEDVRILALAPKYDLALIRVPGLENNPVLRVAAQVPGTEDDIVVIGSPRGLPNQILRGKPTSAQLISSLQLSSSSGKAIFAERLNVLPIDVTVYGGMSGAPILDRQGAVVGVLSGSFDENRGIAWAIPASYLNDVLNAKATERRVSEVIAWPAFTLMKPGWVSLKRNYNVALTAEHIAELEVLEGILRRVKGTWTATNTVNQTITDSIYTGRCEGETQFDHRIEFTGVDVETAELKGYATLRQSKQVTYLGENRYARQDCYKRVSGHPDEDSTSLRLAGELFAKSDLRAKEFNNVLLISIDVVECETGRGPCRSRAYGKAKAQKAELLSGGMIRWGEALLRKQ